MDIVHCAQETTDHIVIVSRDFDYGHPYKGSVILNDWLGQEFRQRVSTKRKIEITDRLSQAFKLAGVTVSARIEREEEELLEEIEAEAAESALAGD